MTHILSDTELLTIKLIAEQDNQATFEIEPLSPGFGVTIGNSLRRILLSSLNGAAITSVRVDGITHEFTTIPGMREDVVSLIINLKRLRMRLHGTEPVSLILQKKGAGTITAADFKPNPAVEFITLDQPIANLDRGANLSMEVEVQTGRGYSPVEARRDDKLPLGTIAIDSIFSPVTRVTYEIEHTRVGKLTNYDKLIMVISTDGSIAPQSALQTAAKIAVEHFAIIGGIDTQTPTEPDVIDSPADGLGPNSPNPDDDQAPSPKRRSRVKDSTKALT